MERKSFIFHKEWAEALKKLPKDVRVEVYDAIIEFGLSGTTSAALKPVAEALFTAFRARLEADRMKYEAKCQRLRETGKKGGEANAKRYQALPSISKQQGSICFRNAYNDNDNDNDIEREKEKKERERCSGASAPRAHTIPLSDSFLKFWEAYPVNQRKTVPQRTAAAKLWVESGLDTVADKVMDALAFCKESQQWEDANFIPAAPRWLHGRLWETDITSARARARTKTPLKSNGVGNPEREATITRERLISTISALGRLTAEQIEEFDETARILGKKTYKELVKT